MFFDDGDPIIDNNMAAVVSRLMESIIQQAVAEMYVPHVLICREISTGVVSHQGPYPTGLAAVCAAVQEASGYDANDGTLEFSVAPLHPGADPLG